MIVVIQVLPFKESFLRSILTHTTDKAWGKARFADMLITLQWLYEKHPNDQQHLLMETMFLLKERSFDWPGYWTQQSFMNQDLDTIQPPITETSPMYGFSHGGKTPYHFAQFVPPELSLSMHHLARLLFQYDLAGPADYPPMSRLITAEANTYVSQCRTGLEERCS